MADWLVPDFSDVSKWTRERETDLYADPKTGKYRAVRDYERNSPKNLVIARRLANFKFGKAVVYTHADGKKGGMEIRPYDIARVRAWGKSDDENNWHYAVLKSDGWRLLEPSDEWTIDFEFEKKGRRSFLRAVNLYLNGEQFSRLHKEKRPM